MSILTVANQKTYGQVLNDLQTADSLYMNKNWGAAKMIYLKYLGDTSKNSMIWNRLGFCNQNLGLYTEAVEDYKKSLANNPNPLVKGSAMSRLAMVYSIQHQTRRINGMAIESNGHRIQCIKRSGQPGSFSKSQVRFKF